MKNRIIIDSEIQAGKPVVAGTRIPVSLILNLLENGYDFNRIIQAYPVLTQSDIKAALKYSSVSLAPSRNDYGPAQFGSI